MKATLSAATILGGLLLIGAGCQQNQPAAPVTTTPDTNATATNTETNQSTTETFTLSATSDTHGIVKTGWTAPANLPNSASFRLLHSVQSNVEFPSRAFWTSLTKDKTRLDWVGVPSGKRYFRICVFEKGACTQYSNEVEVDVK